MVKRLFFCMKAYMQRMYVCLHKEWLTRPLVKLLSDVQNSCIDKVLFSENIKCILLFCQELIISVFLKYIVLTMILKEVAIFLFNRKSISCQSSEFKWLRTTFLCAGSKNNKEVHKVRRKAVDNGRHRRSEICVLCGMTQVPSDISVSLRATKRKRSDQSCHVHKVIFIKI